MSYLDNILFAILLVIGFGFFYTNIKKIVRNINLGTDVNRSDNPKERWTNMAMIALGQSKMVKRPVAGFLHIVVYLGFIIININGCRTFFGIKHRVLLSIIHGMQ